MTFHEPNFPTCGAMDPFGRFFDLLYSRSPIKQTLKFATEIEEIDVKFLFLVT